MRRLLVAVALLVPAVVFGVATTRMDSVRYWFPWEVRTGPILCTQLEQSTNLVEDGTQTYCADCLPGSDPCACAPQDALQKGAFAWREEGRWRCGFGGGGGGFQCSDLDACPLNDCFSCVDIAGCCVSMAGGTCTTNADCCEGFCVGGFCRTTGVCVVGLGGMCMTSAECCEGFCLGGVCVLGPATSTSTSTSTTSTSTSTTTSTTGAGSTTSTVTTTTTTTSTLIAVSQFCTYLVAPNSEGDNAEIFSADAPNGVRLVSVGCHCRGVCSTAATFVCHDRSGQNVDLTGGGNVICQTGANAIIFTTFSTSDSDRDLTSGEVLQVDTANTPSSAGDDGVLLCVRYSLL